MNIRLKEEAIKLSKDKPYLFFSSTAVILILLTTVMISALIWEALPALTREGLINFIFGTEWGEKGYGIWHFMMGTVWLTTTTMIMAIPLSLLTAIYLAEYAHPKIRYFMKSSIELLVGIPSVVYGIFGLFILKDPIRDHINPLISNTLGTIIPIFRDYGGDGRGVFLASTMLTIMIIPTIISIAEDAMRSVRKEFREGSIALGATKWETIQKIVIPTALPGIMAGITLGVMRAVGETMAIVMLLGNVMKTPRSIFDTGYAMTSVIVNEITEAYGLNPELASALFGMAVMLFIVEAAFILLMRTICHIYQGGGRDA